MHCCEFCVSEYEARPQVKNPRACQKPECQRERQRVNEREWHERHPGLYSNAVYHAAKRQQRIRQIQSIAAAFQKCFQVGVSVCGVKIAMAEFCEIFERFFLRLGLRQINKFWKFENAGNFGALDPATNES